MNKKYVVLFIVGYSQNTSVTDSSTYVAKSSAMLGVQSSTKGFLVPRMTTIQREAIFTANEGLLVYDTDLLNFYFYTSGQWTIISGSEYLHANGDSLYIIEDDMRLGIGAKSPVGRMVVVGSSTAPVDEPLFEVKNSAGKSIFAVYEDEVKVNFVEGIKGNKGGFAVGGLSPGKILSDNHLTIDSARIYVENSAKGDKGGFVIGGLSPGKTVASNFLDLTSNNYFIGDQSGSQNVSGLNNSVLGYNAGFSNYSGCRNVFLGTSSGYENYSGNQNVFIGNNSGYNNYGGSTPLGCFNVCIGNVATINKKVGGANTIVGAYAGKGVDNPSYSGYFNNLLGYKSGYDLTTGFDNVLIGYYAGEGVTSGSNLLYVENNTETLVYGEFDNKILELNGNVAIDMLEAPTQSLDVNGNARFRSVASCAYSTPLNLTSDGTLTVSSSDKRLKTNIEPLSNTLSKILKLKPVTYNWLNTNNKRNMIGMVTQEVEEVVPELVFTNSVDGYIRC